MSACQVDKNGDIVGQPKSGTSTTKWLVKPSDEPLKPGMFLRFLDETENLNDEFVQVVVDNASKDPSFMDSAKNFKVQ